MPAKGVDFYYFYKSHYFIMGAGGAAGYMNAI
jgi:hypothetical protein